MALKDWSIDALRLAGRLQHRTTPITYARIAQICQGRYENKTPEEIAAELVAHGFLVPVDNYWKRTKMKYTKAMSSQLLSLVQDHVRRTKRSDGMVNELADEVQAAVYKWFGSFAKVPVYMTGYVHYLKDDE